MTDPSSPMSDAQVKAMFDEMVADLPDPGVPAAMTLSSRLLRSTPAPPPVELDDTVDIDRFVPEPPAPIPAISRPARLALAGVLGGPLLLVLVSLLGLGVSAGVVTLAVLLFLAGCVGLVSRMRDTADADSESGARV